MIDKEIIFYVLFGQLPAILKSRGWRRTTVTPRIIAVERPLMLWFFVCWYACLVVRQACDVVAALSARLVVHEPLGLSRKYALSPYHGSLLMLILVACNYFSDS